MWCTTFGPPHLSVNQQNSVSNVIENCRKQCEEYRQFLFMYNICSKYFAVIRKLILSNCIYLDIDYWDLETLKQISLLFKTTGDIDCQKSEPPIVIKKIFEQFQ